MNVDRTKVVEMLKKEIAFLESGGYERSSRFPWRVPYIFEESPSCPNFRGRCPHRCDDCWLMEFVAPELRTEQVPCRFVELTTRMTVDSLYRSGTSAETEGALATWPRQRIREIEEQIRETKMVVPA